MFARILGAVGVLLAVGLAYSNHFGNEFHFDDSHTVVDNPYIRDLRNIPRFFTDARTFSILPRNRTYRPVVSTSLAIDYRLGQGVKPLWFHVSTFFWFLVQLAVMFALFRLVCDRVHPDPRNFWVALFAVAWYGVHPAMAETVNYVIQRGDLYCTLGVAAAVWIYAQWPGVRKYGLYLLPFVAAVLSKPPALIFPAILFLYIWLIEMDAKARALGRAVVRTLPALVSAGLLVYFTIRMTPPEFNPAPPSAFAFRITQPLVAMRFFRAFLIPDQLSADTDRQALHSIWQDGAWGGFVFVAGLVVITIACSRRREWRPIAFAAGWFLLALVPAAAFPVYEVENDHRMFFPFLALPLAFCWPLALWMYRRPAAAAFIPRIVIALGICELAVLGFATRQRNVAWRTEESLWLDVTRKSPRNGRGWMNYAVTRLEKGDNQTALAYLERARRYAPNLPRVELNLAVAEAGMKRHIAAEQHFRRALQLGPHDSACLIFYGRWLGQQERYSEGLEYLRVAAIDNPDVLDAFYARMDIFRRQARWADVRAVAEGLLRRFPGDIDSKAYLIMAAWEAGGLSSVPQDLQTADNFLSLSALYYAGGEMDRCIAAANHALRLRPGLRRSLQQHRRRIPRT